MCAIVPNCQILEYIMLQNAQLITNVEPFSKSTHKYYNYTLILLYLLYRIKLFYNKTHLISLFVILTLHMTYQPRIK